MDVVGRPASAHAPRAWHDTHVSHMTAPVELVIRENDAFQNTVAAIRLQKVTHRSSMNIGFCERAINPPLNVSRRLAVGKACEVPFDLLFDIIDRTCN